MSAGAISGAAQSSQTAGTNPFAALSTSQFLKVMLSELSNQDPLNPQDTSKMMEQFSSLRNIESQLQLQDKLQSLVLQNQIALAGALIGKQVTGLADDNSNINGQVTSVRVQNGQAVLELDTGQQLSMARVTQIANAAAAAVAQ